MNALHKLIAEYRLLGDVEFRNRYCSTDLKTFRVKVIYPGGASVNAHLPLYTLARVPTRWPNYSFEFIDSVDLNKTYNKKTGELE